MPVKAESVEKCSFTIYRYNVKNISTLNRDHIYYSPEFHVQLLNWAIAYKVISIPERNDKVLSLYISNCGSPRNHLPIIKMEVTLKVVNQIDTNRSLQKDFNTFFDTSIKQCYGFKHFMFWKDLLEPERGFIQNDQVTIEICIAATPPQPKFEWENPCDAHHSHSGYVSSVSVSEDVCAQPQREEDDTQRKNNSPNLSLKERSQYLLTSGLGSDCEFLVGEDDSQCNLAPHSTIGNQTFKMKFRASSIMLARASPVFERMFFGEMVGTSPVRVPDVDPDTFYQMLQFAYGCAPEMQSHQEALNTFYLADKYLINDLKTKCLKHVWPRDETNVWPAFQLCGTYHLPELQAATIKIVCTKITKIIAQPEFTDLSLDCILMILHQDRLVVKSELMLFRAILKWGRSQCEQKGLPLDGPNIRSKIKDALQYIRFLSMTADEFVSDPVTSGVLTQQEQLYCLLSIVQPRLHSPPTTLCALRKPRLGI